jgi:hypothetical protein
MRCLADAINGTSCHGFAAMKAVALFILMLLVPLSVSAQSHPPPVTPSPAPPTPKQRFFFGGGIGLSFGDVDYVELAPLVGYHFLPKLDGGLQLVFQYQHDSRYPEPVTLSNYGANLFTRYFVAPSFFVEAAYEFLNYEYALPSLDTSRSTFNSFLAGGGYFQPMGHSAGFYFSALYNFSYNGNDPYSPYTDPWDVQAGVTVGF